jgi:hypothetical protein
MIAERQIAQIALAGLCASLVTLLVYISVTPLPEFVAPTVQLPLRQHLTIHEASYAIPPPDMFAEIDARPMFRPSRQPIAEPAEAQANLKPPDVTLVGIILDPWEKIALLRIQASPLAVAFRLGATIAGWQLSEIAADKIVLSNGTSNDEIRLDAHQAQTINPVAAQQAAQ